ncbi:MAG: hypothetical protein EOO05_20310 [Chitinophagaceae bacterium]|nr:MAG: hypothetical protein EOO05_20310 [Chitinophagaceae bacterium]
MITGTATVQNRQKYKLYNYVLIGLLAITLLFRLIAASTLMAEGEMLGLVASLVGILLPALFIYGFINYMGAMYKFCGFMTVLAIVQVLARGNFDVLVMIDLVILALMAFLSFYLAGKMFPNFSPAKLKKDENGGYLLN